MEDTAQIKPKQYTRLEWLQFVLFWSWNLVFLAFMSFGFAPILLPQTFTGVRTGIIPASFLLYALVLASIPVIVVVLGLTVLRRSPGRLFALGYVIEGPLMLMLAVRFFLIRQATPGTLLLMSIALVGMAGFLWYLLDPRAGSRRTSLEALRLCGLTLMALTSLYAAAWIAFYALPLGVEAVRGLIDFLVHLPRELINLARSLRDLFIHTPLMLPFSILGFILLLYTATLFVLTPIAVPYLSLKAWRRSFSQLSGRLGRLRPLLVTTMVVAASVVLFILANQQPQAKAFAMLEKPPASSAEAQTLLEQSDTIRSGLLNAYLAPFRYISAEGEVRHVSDIYANTFRIPRLQANAVQRLYEGLASPLLYKPVHRPELANFTDNRALVQEPQEAAHLYQGFFDTPITVAERPAIVRGVRSTWSSDQAEAAWQAVDDREVHLLRQELSVQEHGDWAELELHEAYQNHTADQQEVIYYFNLPESAVLTGVWLGNSPDKSAAYSYQVAPRGAAQGVYREQTRIMKDPALLEQIGPRQYRLRVYPVPPMRITYDARLSSSLVEEAPPLYMWLAWREMAQADAWPLPQLAFLRNVYWDAETQRLADGQPMQTVSEAWLPKSLPALGMVTKQAHRVDLEDGQSALAIPIEQIEMPGLPEGLRMAVVLDRSRSMQTHAEQTILALQQLKSLKSLEQPVDVYLTASPFRGEGPSVVPLDALEAQSIVYFGGQNAAQLLGQFEALRAAQRSDSQYQAVIVLTDGSGYELGSSETQVLDTVSPIWVVHLGGDIPLGYDDQTLQAIQASGGGVAGSVDEALARIAVGLSARDTVDVENAQVVDLMDGYLWSVLPTAQVEAAIPSGVQAFTHGADEPFAALAARSLVLAEMQRNRGTISQLETLDALHALAVKHAIVTPYSSMIVLVNSQQQVMLDRLTQGNDRYQREVEALGDTVPGSPLPLAGVPEPHEWLLLGLAAVLLIYLAVNKRVSFVRSRPMS